VKNENTRLYSRGITLPNRGYLWGNNPSFRRQRRSYAATSFPVGSGSGRILEMQAEWGE
jgi:hypothetical protein